MNAALLAAILGAGGLGAIFAAIVTGLFSKRKLGAEATEIITKAAAGVVTNMQAEIDRQVARNEILVTEHRREMQGLVTDHRREVDKLVDDHDAKMAEMRDVLQLHGAWDFLVVEKMADVGVELPPAPPLLPPPKYRD